MIIQKLIKWLMKNLRVLLNLFEGKKIRYGIIFNSLFMAISIIKRFKTFRFVRWIILGLGIANLIFSIFIVISFSDIDFSIYNIPTLSMIISIIIGIFPIFFTDSWFYIYQGVKASVGTLLSGIIGNIVTTPDYNFEAKYLNGVTEQEYDEYFDENIPKGDQDTGINKSNYTKYLLILAGITLLGLGVVYYYHPEYYALMYEYVSNIFNRRGGGPDPDPDYSKEGTNNNIDNNLSTERLRGKAAHDIINRTVNKVNDNCASSYAYLNNIEQGLGATRSGDFLKNVEELINRNDKILANFSKLPQPALMDIDNDRYNELLNYNNQLKEFVEKTHNFPSSIVSVPSSPESVPQDLLSSQETIKPKSSQTIIDNFFKSKKDNSINLPSSSSVGIHSGNDSSSIEDTSSIYIADTRTNVENTPPIAKSTLPDSGSTTSVVTEENKAKLKNIWKRFGSKKPPVGETTINPEYAPSTKSRASSILEYPPIPETD
jgi:hypothetical protein